MQKTFGESSENLDKNERKEDNIREAEREQTKVPQHHRESYTAVR